MREYLQSILDAAGLNEPWKPVSRPALVAWLIFYGWFLTYAYSAHGGFLFCGAGCGTFGSFVRHSPNLDCGDFSVKVVRHIGGSAGCGKVAVEGKSKSPPQRRKERDVRMGTRLPGYGGKLRRTEFLFRGGGFGVVDYQDRHGCGLRFEFQA